MWDDYNLQASAFMFVVEKIMGYTDRNQGFILTGLWISEIR